MTAARAVSFLLVALFAAAALTGCGPSEDKPKTPQPDAASQQQRRAIQKVLDRDVAVRPSGKESGSAGFEAIEYYSNVLGKIEGLLVSDCPPEFRLSYGVYVAAVRDMNSFVQPFKSRTSEWGQFWGQIRDELTGEWPDYRERKSKLKALESRVGAAHAEVTKVAAQYGANTEAFAKLHSFIKSK